MHPFFFFVLPVSCRFSWLKIVTHLRHLLFLLEHGSRSRTWVPPSPGSSYHALELPCWSSAFLWTVHWMGRSTERHLFKGWTVGHPNSATHRLHRFVPMLAPSTPPSLATHGGIPTHGGQSGSKSSSVDHSRTTRGFQPESPGWYTIDSCPCCGSFRPSTWRTTPKMGRPKHQSWLPTCHHTHHNPGSSPLKTKSPSGRCTAIKEETACGILGTRSPCRSSSIANLNWSHRIRVKLGRIRRGGRRPPEPKLSSHKSTWALRPGRIPGRMPRTKSCSLSRMTPSPVHHGRQLAPVCAVTLKPAKFDGPLSNNYPNTEIGNFRPMNRKQRTKPATWKENCWPRPRVSSCLVDLSWWSVLVWFFACC